MIIIAALLILIGFVVIATAISELARSVANLDFNHWVYLEEHEIKEKK